MRNQKIPGQSVEDFQSQERANRTFQETLVFTLTQADKHDKYSPHFLLLRINEMRIFTSFETPVAFRARNGKAGVLFGTGHNQDMHAHKAASTLKTWHIATSGTPVAPKKFNSKIKFEIELMTELKKELVHASSEIMKEAFGIDP